ncbi:helix-turn-helix domain-containing protein [Oceanobacillus kapialis]|uniref:helix-turn-helix domain-containing protein n=1 Tax=Oceanobacillus kapialis TaxID=481353 RepID=UPI00384A4E0B
MLWNKKHKPKLLYKYFISYLIIFLIPFLTISLVFYQMSVSNLREQIIQSNIDKVEQVRDFADSRKKELSEIASRISFDHRLTPYMFSQPYHSKQAIEELKTYKANSSIIDELYMYFEDRSQIYTTIGTSKLPTFMEKTYHMADSEVTNYQTTLEEVAGETVYPLPAVEDEQERVISYLYPLPVGNSVHYGTVAFFVKESTFTQMSERVLGDFEGSMFIYNEQDDLIASTNKGLSLDADIVRQVAPDNSGVTEKVANEEQYSLVTVKSEESGWSFVTAMPTAQFYSKMDSLRTTIITILSAIAGIGFLFIIIMTIQQYRPIRRLAQTVQVKQQREEHDRRYQDELEGIQESIQIINKDKEQLNERLQGQQPLIKEQLLQRLLKGKVQHRFNIGEYLEETGISFEIPYFFVLITVFHEQSEEDNLERAYKEKGIAILEEMKYGQAKGYSTELVQDHAIATIVNISKPDAAKQMVDYISSQLSKHIPLSYTMGVGGTYKGIERLNRSYIEANATLESQAFHQDRNIVFFKDLNISVDEVFWYPTDKQAKLSQSLKQGDEVVALETLQDIFGYLTELEAPHHLIRCICFDIINSVIKFPMEMGLQKNFVDIQTITSFKSLDDLQQRLEKPIALICREMEKQRENNNNALANSILQYIAENFHSHDISLEETAKAFQLSSSYISRFIKEQTGNTFTKYVWNLRNEEFKKQLVETDKPIKEIVLDIGYVDVANFTRKFKRAEGVTPGQYRQQHFNQTEAMD